MINKAGGNLAALAIAKARAQRDAHTVLALDNIEVRRMARQTAEAISDHPYEQSLCAALYESVYLQELRAMAAKAGTFTPEAFDR